ncbi:U32 family peptidase [Candidatus Gracilibacteria bacterium]|nr:U32 family peptidase [Candidatus Gracilibacteria bacterium]
MHIIAGLSPDYVTYNHKVGNNFKRIDKLIEQGVKEFFLGYVPSYWYENLAFEVSPNGRQHAKAQIQKKEVLKEIVDYVHSKGLRTMLTVNANSYNSSVWPKVKQIINDAVETGVDGLVLSDFGVLNYLKEINYKGLINLSTIFSIYNSEAIKFFLKQYKIDRIIMPREVALTEIRQMCEEFPDTKFEVFLSGDKCVWNNGFCFVFHNALIHDPKTGKGKYFHHSPCQYIEKNYDYRKATKYEFKDLILGRDEFEGISEYEKLKLINNFTDDTIEDFGEKFVSGEIEDFSELYKIFRQFSNKVLLVYDPSVSSDRKHNKDMQRFIFGADYLLKNFSDEGKISEKDEKKFSEMQKFLKEKIQEISEGKKYYLSKIKEFGTEYIKEIDTFEWNRSGVEAFFRLKDVKNIEALKLTSRGKGMDMILDYMTGITEVENKVEGFLGKDNATGKLDYYKMGNKLI